MNILNRTIQVPTKKNIGVGEDMDEPESSPTLLPFEDSRYCLKCAAFERTDRNYCSGCAILPAQEHLHCHCLSCGYAWFEKCAALVEDEDAATSPRELVVTRSAGGNVLIGTRPVANADAVTPDDDWRSHGTVGYDARMSETTGPSNMVLGRKNVPAGPSAGPAKVPPDQLIGSNAGRAVTYLTGYPLGQPSTFECPWRGCGKAIDIAADSCGTGTTWSLFRCRSCGKLCASGSHIPTSVQMDPDVLIIAL